MTDDQTAQWDVATTGSKSAPGDRPEGNGGERPTEHGAGRHGEKRIEDSRGTDTESKGPTAGSKSTTVSRSNSPAESRAFRQWCGETNALLADAESARIDVYVRTMLPPPGAKDAQVDVLDDLNALCEGSPIQDVRINVWGERICCCDRCRQTDAGRRMLDTVRQLERWGVEYDASVESFFERTKQQSSLVDSTHHGIAPPRVTAVLYVEQSLQGAFPARFGDERYSVHDLAAAISRETDAEGEREPVESTR